MTFGEYVATLSDVLDRRQALVEQIETRLLNPRVRPALPPDLGRLSAELTALHVADGFEPIAFEGTAPELDPVVLATRAHQHWEHHRWPGRNLRLRYAARLYAVFVIRQLERLSLRIWDEGDAGAGDRLAQVQGLLDRANNGALAEPLVRDARWLIQTAQGPLTRRLEPYFRIADRVATSFTVAARLEIHKAGAVLTSGHLRSQLRHRAAETDRAIDDPEVLAVTRNSNSMDAALLVRDLVPLLEAYGTASTADAIEARIALADAILQAVSADPELLLSRLDLLGPCTMIEDLFIDRDQEGHLRYTPTGEAQRRLLGSYAELLGRHAQSLLEDARRLDPRQSVYSPLGLAYGFCADMLSNMALDTLLARPSFNLTLEDMFASRGSLENKRARAEGWTTPSEQEGARYPVDYSEGWRTQMFDRTTSALRARAEHRYRGNASTVPDARLFVVPEVDPDEPPAGRVVPDGIARAQEHCLTSDLQRALATGATAFPRGQILNDRNEGRFLASAESGGKWFGISKVVLTLCTSQGKDALLTGVPPPVVEAMRLTCPGLAVTE